MSMNMKRIVCYYLAISMIPLKECAYLDGDCMELQLLVEETHCGYNNMTSLTMYTINNESLVTSLNDGCAVGFDAPLYLNNTFYLECDTETSCFDGSKAISRETYYLECEEMEIINKRTINPKEHNESTTESYLLRNQTTTELYDKSTAVKGNLSEVYIFTNESNTDLVNSTKADVFTFESSTAAVESISKNYISISSEGYRITTESTRSIDGIFINDVANLSKTNVITTESSTAVYGILIHHVANSSEVHVFTTKTTTDLYDKLKDNHNSIKADIDNKTTTEHHDVLKDINATSTKIDELNNKTDVHSVKAAKENSSDSSNVLAILGYSLASVGATLALAFGAYRLKNALQSGSYLIPETPRPPAFTELA
ncbi:uncharacterized protein LOC134664782 [Cydia fagiglandana]|uniref:uncharacterized protein LOC134664782 n=1 Tax=Cydia fagiglandana TaxID=1458189 RepID=UPI002FEE5712